MAQDVFLCQYFVSSRCCQWDACNKTLISCFDDLAVMSQSVQGGCCHLFVVVKHIGPFVQLADQVEEYGATGLTKRQIIHSFFYHRFTASPLHRFTASPHAPHLNIVARRIVINSKYFYNRGQEYNRPRLIRNSLLAAVSFRNMPPHDLETISENLISTKSDTKMIHRSRHQLRAVNRGW